jgi:serine/threonine protein kinase
MVHHFKGCSIPLNKYYAVEGKIGEGTFGHVFTGKRLADGQAVAIKRLVLTHPPPTPTTSATEPSSAITKPSETVDAVTTTQMNQLGFPLITLREIKIIKSLPRHENILHMLDMAASGRPQSPHSIAGTYSTFISIVSRCKIF